MKNLGKIGIDKVSGFTGMITARINYLYGEDEYKLTPTKLSNGTIGTEIWLPVSRIKISENSTERQIGFSDSEDLNDYIEVCSIESEDELG